jgi:TatD DNase family protein
VLFDTHAHLHDPQFDADREEVMRRAREEFGVHAILNVGYNRETIQASLQLAERVDFIYAAVGWHPHEADACTTQDLAWIRQLTRHPKVVALGEMGLDYYRNRSARDRQADIFRQQIAIAKETGLPLIIHDRDAHEDVVQILKEEQADEVGGVMHCFSGDLSMMEACLQLNFYIGLGGPVTFKNAKLPKEIATHVPADRLLLETDCPYLAPHPYRGKRNETGYVRLIAETIAHIRGIDLPELAAFTTMNAKNLFKLGNLT